MLRLLLQKTMTFLTMIKKLMLPMTYKPTLPINLKQPQLAITIKKNKDYDKKEEIEKLPKHPKQFQPRR